MINVYSATKTSSFVINYGRNQEFILRKKFINKMKKRYEKIQVVLRKLQEKIKKYANRNQRKLVEFKVEDKVLLSIRDLVYKMVKKRIKKLTDRKELLWF